MGKAVNFPFRRTPSKGLRREVPGSACYALLFSPIFLRNVRARTSDNRAILGPITLYNQTCAGTAKDHDITLYTSSLTIKRK
jgi:hypothetical protein